MQERHTVTELDLPNKIFFSNNFTIDIFLFVTAIISLLVTIIVMYILCKYIKLKTLVTSLTLQILKEVGMVDKQESIFLASNNECTCKTQWYTILILSLSILVLALFAILKSRKLKLFRGPVFSNVVKIMLVISDAQYYVPIKLCRIAGNIHLFKIMRMLTPENIKLNQNLIWVVIELD